MSARLIHVLAIHVLASAPLVSAQPDHSARFNAWLDTTWEETLVRAPILATAIGDSRYNDRIVNTTTAEWRADNRRFIQRQLKELAGFDRNLLAGRDRLSYDILKRDLQEQLEGERFPDWTQPLNQAYGLPSFLAQMGSGGSVAAEKAQQ